MFKKLNPFSSFYVYLSGLLYFIKYIPTVCKAIKTYIYLIFLQIRYKRWLDKFPGMDSLLNDNGRDWIIRGFDLAGELVRKTPSTIDDVIVYRGNKIVASDEGWSSIKTIVRLSVESPEPTATNDIDNQNGLVELLVEEADGFTQYSAVMGGEDDTEDPMTILYVIILCIRIAAMIREFREQRKISKLRIRRYYQDIETRFLNRILKLKK